MKTIIPNSVYLVYVILFYFLQRQSFEVSTQRLQEAEISDHVIL